MELKNIAVLGPRGNVGKSLIEALNAHTPRFNLTGVTRPNAEWNPPAKVAHLTMDYSSPESLVTALKGQDAVVCCVSGSATQFDCQKLIIDACIQAGVKLFIADEFVGNVMSERFRRMPEVAVGSKVRIRKYLEKRLGKGLAEDDELGKGGMKWTSLNGGPFFDMWLMKGPAGFDIKNRQARIYGDGKTPLLWTSLPQIVQALTNMLLNPLPFVNRPIHICGTRDCNQLAILSALEKQFNQNFEVQFVDVDKMNWQCVEKLEKGEWAVAMRGLTISGQFCEEAAKPSLFFDLCENEKVGVEMISVKDAVEDAVENWGVGEVVEAMFKVDPLYKE